MKSAPLSSASRLMTCLALVWGLVVSSSTPEGFADESSEEAEIRERIAELGTPEDNDEPPAPGEPQPAAHALASIGWRAVPALIEVLRSEGGRKRLRAIAALRWMGSEARPAKDALLRIARVERAEAGKAAILALSAIAPESPDVQPLVWEALRWSKSRSEERRVLLRGIASLGRGAQPVLGDLIGFLREACEDPRRIQGDLLLECRDIADVLAGLEETAEEAVPYLRKILFETGDHAVAEAIGRIGGSEATKALHAALLSANGSLNAAAMRGVVHQLPVNHEIFLPLLARFLATPEYGLGSQQDDVRLGALHMLGNLGDRARSVVPEIVKAARHSDWRTRLEAVRALGKIGETSDAVIEVLNAAEQDPRTEIVVEAQAAKGRLLRK